MRLSRSFALQQSLVYGIALTILCGAIVSIPSLVQAVEILWMRAQGKTAVACGCSIILSTTDPLLLILTIGTSALLLFGAIRLITTLALTLYTTHRTLNNWELVSSRNMSFNGIAFTLRVVRLDTPLLCSAGLLRHSIYISTHTLQQLSRDELLAATLHELGHLRAHHPAHFILFTAIIRACGLTRFAQLRSYHAFAHEHSADTFALQFIDRSKLLSAITHFFGTARAIPTSLPHFSLEESRIKLLLGYQAPRAPREISLTLTALLCGICLGFIPLTLFARSDTLPAAQPPGSAACAYVEPPPEEYICVQDVGQTLLLYPLR